MNKKHVCRRLPVFFGLILALTLPAAAQNLGLGAGRQAADDSARAADAKASGDRQDDSPRKSQLNRRLGLTARHGKEFDPKVFEARGRELQGEFYEIFTPGSMPGKTSRKSETGTLKAKDGSHAWLIWVGVAGAVGAAGATGAFIMMEKSHPSLGPATPVNLDDNP